MLRRRSRRRRAARAGSRLNRRSGRDWRGLRWFGRRRLRRGDLRRRRGGAWRRGRRDGGMRRRRGRGGGRRKSGGRPGLRRFWRGGRGGRTARRGRLRRGRSRLGRRLARAVCRRKLRLDLRNRLFERALLPLDIAVGQRRTQGPELRHERHARTVIDRMTRRSRTRTRKVGDGAREQRLIVSHAECARSPTSQSRNGSWTRIVSSRSGLVDNSATGTPTSSSIRRTYFIACAGRSAHERALLVTPFQPSIVS